MKSTVTMFVDTLSKETILNYFNTVDSNMFYDIANCSVLQLREKLVSYLLDLCEYFEGVKSVESILSTIKYTQMKNQTNNNFMKITVTVVKGINAGKVRIFDNSAKAAKYADKMDLQYGAICTQKKYDFNA